MLKALLKVNLLALLSWLSGSAKRGGKAGKGSKGKAVLYSINEICEENLAKVL